MVDVKIFKDVHGVLEGFVPAEGSAATAYSLERIVALMDKLGNPQDSYKVIHVAGTSGKTSTCYYMASLLKVAGQKVGLTISPHIEEVNERVQIDLNPLSEAEFCAIFSEFLGVVAATGIKPTYFELMVAMAYWEFARRKVDYAVVEVGLGGLLDGTNVITRPDKVCVITDIGLDHTHILGNTLALIAAQKAGIIQPGNRVFMHEQPQEVLNVVKGRTSHKKGVLQIISSQVKNKNQLPQFQQRNFELAKTVYDYIASRDHLPKLDAVSIQQAQAVTIPGRMEIFNVNKKTVILDGAHNAQKMIALVESIHQQFGDQKVAVLLSVVGRPNFQTRIDLKPLLSIVSRLIITEYGSTQEEGKKSVPASQLAKYCTQIGFKDIQIANTPAQGLQQLLACPEPILLVTGSLYLMGHIRPLVKALVHSWIEQLLP